VNKTFRDTKPMCPPCLGDCQQGRTCPWNHPLPEPELEDQTDSPGVAQAQFWVAVGFGLCVLGSVVSCVVSR
jgi:hypothetical protein